MSAPRRLLVRVGLVAAARPAWVLIICAVVLAASVAGTLRIHPTASIESMLARQGAAPRAMARVMREFGVLDELHLLVTAPPAVAPDRSTAAQRLREFGERLAASVRSHDRLSAMCADVAFCEPDDLRRFTQEQLVPAALLYLDDEAVAELRGRFATERIRDQIQRNEELIAAAGMATHTLAKTILRDPLRLHETLLRQLGPRFPSRTPAAGQRLLLSNDGRTLMIRIRGEKSGRDLDVARELTAGVQELSRGIKPKGWRIEYTGAYAIATMSERSIRRDMIVSITASIFLLMLLFFLVYGRATVFLLAVAPVGVGIVTAFGISSVYSTELTPVVAVIGALLAGLAIDYSVHFLSHFGRGRSLGMETLPALQRSLEAVSPAMAAACMTSIIGFLAIGQSSVSALRHFAVLGALGLGCALLAAITVLPAMLAVLGDRKQIVAEPRLLRGGLVPVLRHLEQRPWPYALAALALMAGGAVIGWASPGGALQFARDLTVMHPRPNPPLEAQHSISERFGHDPEPLIVHLAAPNPQELLERAHGVNRALQSERVRQAGVAGAFGPASLLPDPARLNERIRALASFDVERIIEDLDAALGESVFEPAAYDGYRAFLRRLFDPDPPTWDTVRRYPDLAGLMLPSSFIIKGDAPATEAIALILMDRPLIDRDERDTAIDAVREVVDGIDGATLTGVSIVAHDTEQLIRSDLVRLLWVAAALVIAWLVIFFRSLVRAALAVLPVLFGLATLVCVMAVGELRLNMVNLVALPILVGIGVDDGLFLVTLAHAGGRGDDMRETLVERLGTGCHAVLMTTFTTVLAFGTLALIRTPAIQSLGIMLAVGMVACLLGTVFLLVPILLLSQRRSQP